MATHCSRAVLLLCLGAAQLAFAASATSSPIKSRTVTAGVKPPGVDPALATPDLPGPCVVNLFSNYVFSSYTAQYFQYTPTCQGPWSKVLFKGNFNVSAGVQFDRTANIQLGFVNIYFGTTEEPSPTSAPSWTVQRDLTDYASLFQTAQSGEVDIYNIVDSTYTGIIYGTASLEFYPVASGSQPPVTADNIYPLPNGPGAPFHLNVGTDQLAETFTLPTNIERAYLDVVSQGQQGDEFWYTCVPNEVSGELFSCGNTAFRETEITIDGQPAGVAPVYPWIFTGGIDPYLWIPITGVQTLNFVPYRVDLTPFAGVLSNGQPHIIALSVFNANNYFQDTASLLVYLDHGSSQVTGGITVNTLSAPNPMTVTNLPTGPNGGVAGNLSVTSDRSFVISGYVNTSTGPVVTTVKQAVNFSNVQQFLVTEPAYVQQIQQNSTVLSETTTATASGTTSVEQRFSFPLAVSIAEAPNPQGFQQQTAISQSYLHSSQAAGLQSSSLETVQTTDTLLFDGGGNFLGNTNQKSSEEVTTTVNGNCSSVAVAAKNNQFVGKQTGTGCQ